MLAGCCLFVGVFVGVLWVVGTVVGVEDDWYGVLGVDRSVSAVDLRSAYRGLVRRLHPDVGGDPDEFLRVQRAYEVLSNGLLRREYDASLDAASAVTSAPVNDPVDVSYVWVSPVFTPDFSQAGDPPQRTSSVVWVPFWKVRVFPVIVSLLAGLLVVYSSKLGWFGLPSFSGVVALVTFVGLGFWGYWVPVIAASFPHPIKASVLLSLLCFLWVWPLMGLLYLVGLTGWVGFRLWKRFQKIRSIQT